jgi:hypothetical protein
MPEAPGVPPATDPAEARQAVEQATARLEEVDHRWPAVRRLVYTAAHTLEENHLAERVGRAFGGRQ